ncbi:MAG: hypothetical protein NVSMB45_18500 [Ginsengibacter sp.]
MSVATIFVVVPLGILLNQIVILFMSTMRKAVTFIMAGPKQIILYNNIINISANSAIVESGMSKRLLSKNVFGNW